MSSTALLSEGFAASADATDDAENTPPGASGGTAANGESREGLGAMSVLNERNFQHEREVAKAKDGEAKTQYTTGRQTGRSTIDLDATVAYSDDDFDIHNTAPEVGYEKTKEISSSVPARQTIAEGQVAEAAARTEAGADDNMVCSECTALLHVCVALDASLAASLKREEDLVLCPLHPNHAQR